MSGSASVRYGPRIVFKHMPAAIITILSQHRSMKLPIVLMNHTTSLCRHCTSPITTPIRSCPSYPVSPSPFVAVTHLHVNIRRKRRWPHQPPSCQRNLEHLVLRTRRPPHPAAPIAVSMSKSAIARPMDLLDAYFAVKACQVVLKHTAAYTHHKHGLIIGPLHVILL